MKHICKKQGCNNLLTHRGYCQEHRHIEAELKRDAWEIIKARQAPEERAFYNTEAWHRTSRTHRKKEPLCRRCKQHDIITIGQMVHHNPTLRSLIEQGLNPYNDEYLETLCYICYNRELKK